MSTRLLALRLSALVTVVAGLTVAATLLGSRSQVSATRQVEPSATPACTLGDVNGDGVVDTSDALLILQFAAALIDHLDFPNNADVNGDGHVDNIDAGLILQALAGLYDLCPAVTTTPTGTATPTPSNTPVPPTVPATALPTTPAPPTVVAQESATPTATPTVVPTGTPQPPVGGISFDPPTTGGFSGSDAGLLASAIAGTLAGGVALGGSVWYARRRRVR